MNILHDLFYGFGIALHPWNLLSCFFGVFIGTLVGVLPGIGPVGAMSILLPITFGISPVTGIIMLAGIYYGAMYGGSTTSILVNIPGEAASVVTCLDGHQMALKGRAGPALGIAAFGSFIAGTLGLFGLMFMTNALADIALMFGPSEYFSLMCLGLSLVTYLTQGLGAERSCHGWSGPIFEPHRAGRDYRPGTFFLRVDGADRWCWARAACHGTLRRLGSAPQPGEAG